MTSFGLFSPQSILTLMHLQVWGFAFGMFLWFYCSGFLLRRNLWRNVATRSEFARVQSFLFPWYFCLSTFALGLLVVIHATAAFSAATGVEKEKFQTQLVLLSLSFVACVANQYSIGPNVTDLMHQRIKNEKDNAPQEVVNAVNRKFGMWHGISSLLNLGILGVLIIHSIFISNHLSIFPK